MILKLKVSTPVWCGCLRLTADLYYDRCPRSSLIFYCCNNEGTNGRSSAYESCVSMFISSKLDNFLGRLQAESNSSYWNTNNDLLFPYLCLLRFQGFKLSSVMTSWRFTTVPICCHPWLDPLMEPKSLSSCLAAVTSCICSSPPTTVDQTVASRYSMKVRFMLALFDWHIWTFWKHVMWVQIQMLPGKNKGCFEDGKCTQMPFFL